MNIVLRLTVAFKKNLKTFIQQFILNVNIRNDTENTMSEGTNISSYITLGLHAYKLRVVNNIFAKIFAEL